MQIAFFTLGCKVNQYETELLKEHFTSLNYQICDETDIADIYIVNSCTVTSAANKRSRQIIRRFKRLNPKAIVVLMGCFPQAFLKEALLIKQADIIWGTKNKLDIDKAIDEFKINGERIINVPIHTAKEKFEDANSTAHQDKTRAFVKIQDGCERYCAYCIIPKARGNVRSKPIDSIIDEVKNLVNKGFKEIVLVGINLAMYGVDLNLRLIDAIKAVCEIDGVVRVRLGSSEPMLVTADDFLNMSKYKNLCPHFHIALQSGCDDTLKRMKRPYTTKQYTDIIDVVRKNYENPAITTDIIVGFPGETDEEFLQTIDFVKNISFAMVHIFPYSKREGTLAFDMPNQIDEHIKNVRAKILHDICEENRIKFLKAQIGTEMSVLFEHTLGKYGRMGHTSNYTSVYVKNDNVHQGEIHTIKIIDVIDGDSIGIKI